MIRLGAGSPERIVAVGAHCDDIAIGAGGTLLTVCLARPGVRVDALVLSGGGGEREREERAALAAFCPGADLRLTVLKLPDGRMPAHWRRPRPRSRSCASGPSRSWCCPRAPTTRTRTTAVWRN